MRPLLVLEDTTRPRWRLFSALGVEWWATRWAWAGPLFWVALGWMVARAAGPSAPAGAGLAYGVLLWLSNAVHTLGHVAFARLAGTPMDAVVLTSTRDVTVYRGAKRNVPERTRVVRSLGGPAATAAIGCASLAAALGAAGSPGASDGPWGWLQMFGAFNLCVAAWTLAPVPTMDGWIVWRWVVRRGSPPLH
ncbi:MAG: hypothetical protein FIA95_07790 [Gemmatimonadetes bacterium]|nr:hypothetical protein [Gemmatimonadota bacterium]